MLEFVLELNLPRHVEPCMTEIESAFIADALGQTRPYVIRLIGELP